MLNFSCVIKKKEALTALNSLRSIGASFLDLINCSFEGERIMILCEILPTFFLLTF